MTANRARERSGGRSEVRSAVCTRCGCACDDVDLVLEGERVVEARNACEPGRAWFLEPPREDAAPALIEGREATAEEAVAAAAELLARARRPLVWGLVHAAAEAQRLAVELADRLHGVIDPAAGPNHPAAVTAFQEWGEVNATLGEVARQRSLVVLWRAEPERTHPRLLERWGFEPEASGDGRLIRLGPAAEGWELPRERDLEFLWILRELARERGSATGAPAGQVSGGSPGAGERPEASNSDRSPGSGAAGGRRDLRPLAARLLDRLSEAPHAVLAFDAPSLEPPLQHALRALAATLNGVTRFRLFPLRGAGNRIGAEAVLTWQAGFPVAVDFSAGAPRSNGGELSAARLLERGEVDAALVICASPADYPREPALGRLAEVPLVVLDSSDNPLAGRARVALRSAPYGLASGGTFFRMDGVALSLRPVLHSRYPSEATWLRRILAMLPVGSGAATAAGSSAGRRERGSP
jgi:formylmethanofuran dehydrogenase subunit B